MDPAVVGKLILFLTTFHSIMADSPTKDTSFLDALTLQSSSPRFSSSTSTAPSPTPQGEFHSMSLGIISPSASKGGGVVRFMETSVQVITGQRSR